MRRITSAAKKGKSIGGWRKLHSEEFHNLYAPPNVIRMIEKYELCKKCRTKGRKG
jgi:hypothetical protein